MLDTRLVPDVAKAWVLSMPAQTLVGLRVGCGPVRQREIRLNRLLQRPWHELLQCGAPNVGMPLCLEFAHTDGAAVQATLLPFLVRHAGAGACWQSHVCCLLGCQHSHPSGSKLEPARADPLLSVEYVMVRLDGQQCQRPERF